jgi:hypothetical protein
MYQGGRDMEKNHEINSYSEHFDQLKQRKNAKRQKPWYKNGFIMLILGAAIILMLGFFATQITEALHGVGESIDQQTAAIKDQNRVLSVKNEILRGIERGLSDIEKRLDRLVVEIKDAFYKFVS